MMVVHTCSADAGTVYRYPWNAAAREFGPSDASYDFGVLWDFHPDGGMGGFIIHDIVPWTMITGPDGNLYVAVDGQYNVRTPSSTSLLHGLMRTKF